MRLRSPLFSMVCFALAFSVWGCATEEDTGAPPDGAQDDAGSFFIDNQIAKSSAPACTFADPERLVSLFNPDQQTVPSGRSGPYTISGQFGLQVNFWYWAQTPDMNHTIGTWSCPQGQCNNPDNSGAQFTLGADCSIASQSPPVFGVGKETYVITDVTAAMESGDCVLTIAPNQFTACVTPSCCDFFGPGKCSEGTQGTYAAGCTNPPP